MIALSILQSRREMLTFIGMHQTPIKYIWSLLTRCITAPVIPSLLSYVIGLIFYATQFPECILSEKVRRRLDIIGCGNLLLLRTAQKIDLT